jgi:glycosyltransferase involved in cell wall biosynthesis
MRIGIMLRHYDQRGGGVRVYTHELLRSLLSLEMPHEFVLFYKNPALVGTYRNDPRVTEVAVPGRTVFTWDQIGVPRAVRRHGIDVLYNPKYSIALGANCRTAWVCHGLDWYVMPWASRWIDRQSHRFLVPRYAAKADAIIAVSEITRQHVMEFLHVPAERVHTVYSGVADAFRATTDDAAREAVRRKYGLPERFFLYSGAIYPPKNFSRLVRAYAQVGPSRGIHLVIAGGDNRFRSEHEVKVPEQLGLGEWVRWLGWVDPSMLPALYQMSSALVMPSLFEACPLPILEAFASHLPVLTSNRYGSREIAGDAALLVDPESVEAIADGMIRILKSEELRGALVSAGRQRAQAFTWEACAQQTLRVLEGIAGQPQRRGKT